MAVVLIEPNRKKYFIGLSTDAKPTTDVPAGSEFFEHDTKADFVYTGTAWTSKT